MTSLLSLSGCPQFGEPTGDSTIIIINNSDKLIEFYFDTSIVIMSESLRNYPLLIINPYSKRDIHAWWKQSFETANYRRLYLFDKAVVDSVPWDTIRYYNMYLKRIDFTIKSLDSLNWTLTYP